MKINNKDISFGQVFYNATQDNTTGEIILNRIDGTTVNFKIADMQFVKDKISAASKITLTITASDGKIIASVTNG